MEFTYFVEFVVVVVIALVVHTFFNERRKERKRLQKGFVLIDLLQKVINQTQQHRGTSNAVLQGNDNLKQQLINIDRTIEQLILDGNQQGLKQFSQWEAFVDHWPRLKAHCLQRDISSPQLIRQHSVMIEGQLSLLDEVIQYYHMHTVMFDRVSRMSGFCVDVLRATEMIGQTRAIGSGVCAKGQCNGVEQISLNFLRISLVNTTSTLFKELNEIDNAELTLNINEASAIIKSSIDKLVYTLDNNVLIDGNTTVSSSDYFKISSQPIEELLKVFSIILSYGNQKYI